MIARSTIGRRHEADEKHGAGTMTSTRTSAAVRLASAETSAPESTERAIDETEHLLKSPENAARLRRSIASLEAGRVRAVQVDDLVDVE